MTVIRCSMIGIAFVAAFTGCSKEEGGATGASSALTPTGKAPAAAAPATAASARTTEPAKATDVTGVRGAPMKAGAAPATWTFVSGKPDSGGYYYNAVFEITNTGKKDISAIAYHACHYLPSGKLEGFPAQNGVDVSLKPGAKGTAEISYTLKELGPNHALGLLIHSVKFADGTTWEDAPGSKCEPEVKL